MSKKADLCSANVLKTLEGFEESTIKKMAEDIERLGRVHQGDTAKIRKAYKELFEANTQYFERKRQEIFMNVKKQNEVVTQISDIIDSKSFKDDRARAKAAGELLTDIVSSTGSNLREGAGRSVAAKAQAMSSRIKSYILEALDKDGLYDALQSKQYNLEILREMRAMTTKGYDGKSVTNNSVAFRIAQIFANVDKMKFVNYQDAGVFIRQLDGFTISQARIHSKDAMIAKGKDAWVRFMEEDISLDDAVVFSEAEAADPKLRNKRLREMYDHLVGEKDDADFVSMTDQLLDRNSYGSVRSAVGKSRSIHFKDADSLYKYMLEFGDDDLGKLVLQGIDSASTKAALAQTFGSNVVTTGMFSGGLNKGAIANVKRALKSKYGLQDSDFSGFDKQMRILTGAMRPDDANTLVKASNITHAMLNMSKLSMAPITAGVTDTGFMATTLTSVNGKNFYSQIARTVAESTKAFAGDPAKIKSFLRKQLIAVDSELGEILRFGNEIGSENLPGFLAKSQELFYKITAYNRQNLSSKGTFVKLFIDDLYEMSGKSFDELPAGTKSIFSKHNVGPVEWKIMSMAKDVDDMGYDILSLEAIDRMPDSYFSSRKERREIINKFSSVIHELMYQAAPTPNNRNKGMLMPNEDPNSVTSLAIGHAMKYKSFAFASFDSLVTSVKRASGKDSLKEAVRTKQGAILALQAVSALTTMGYVSLVLRDMLRNKEPREMNTQTAIEALIHGGGLGIYGDLVLRDYTGKFGGSLGEQLAGPTVSVIGEALKAGQTLAKGIATGDTEQIGKGATKGVRFIQRNLIPLNNAPIVQPILDEIVVDGMIRQWDPDYVRRLKNYYRREGREPIIGD